MKIAFFEINSKEKEIFEKALQGNNLFFSEDALNKDNLTEAQDFEIISVFVSSKIDKEVLDNLPNLKYIVTRSMGFDHIDLEQCKKKNVKNGSPFLMPKNNFSGIAVSNAPHYGGNTVAEWTFALILNLLRKVYKAVDQIKESGNFNLENLQGIELAGKTIGVIGAGRIGKEVIKIAKAFGMNIVAYDVRQDLEFSQALAFEYKNNLEDVLKVSDIISLHVNYSQTTHHLINKNNIKLCKKNSYLINTSRGPVVETEALVDALKNKILAGAGLDVLEEENVIKDELEFFIKGRLEEHNFKAILADHILMKMDNVLITPHNAFNSKEAVERIINATIENIKSFINNQPINLIA